jgi:hypothetical protein
MLLQVLWVNKYDKWMCESLIDCNLWIWKKMGGLAWNELCWNLLELLCRIVYKNCINDVYIWDIDLEQYVES